jgi:nucleoporin GLE1
MAPGRAPVAVLLASPSTSQSTHERSPGLLRAPAPYADSSDEDDDAASPPPASFSIRAPSGLTDDDGESDEAEQASSRPHRWSSLPPAAAPRPPTAVEVALDELTERVERAVHVRAQLRVSAYDRALLEVEAEERAALEAAADESAREARALTSAEARRHEREAAGREELLAALRSLHEREAAEAQQRLAEAEGVERAATAAAAAQRAANEEAEARRREDHDAAARAAAAKTLAAADAERLRAARATALPGILSIAPAAAEFRARCAKRLAAAQAAAAPFAEDRGAREAKRAIDKMLTLSVMQISATLDQVRAKSTALADFLGRHQGAQRAYAYVALAGKLLSQCEVQVSRLRAFAFPLAEVTAAVAAAHPDFADVLLGRLHAASPAAVPASYGYRPGADEAAYLRLAGYRVAEGAGGDAPRPEPTDEFVARTCGYVALYAALVQSDNPANPHGLAHGWAWLARALNALPATRATAAALDAFLEVAGWRLARAYRGQFLKAMAALQRDFLPELAAAAEQDPDARAVLARLQAYLRARRFEAPPEGREMPQYDASSYDRA